MAEYTRIVTEVDQYGEIIGRKQTRGWDGWDEAHEGYYYRYKKNNIKMYLDDLPDISANHILYMLKICSFIYADTNLLMKPIERKKKKKLYDEGSYYKAISQKTLNEHLGIAERTFYFFWKEMQKKNIVKRIRIDGILYWAVNPAYFNTCKYVPYWLYEHFWMDLDKFLSSKSALALKNEVLAHGGSIKYPDNSHWSAPTL